MSVFISFSLCEAMFQNPMFWQCHATLIFCPFNFYQEKAFKQWNPRLFHVLRPAPVFSRQREGEKKIKMQNAVEGNEWWWLETVNKIKVLLRWRRFHYEHFSNSKLIQSRFLVLCGNELERGSKSFAKRKRLGSLKQSNVIAVV